MKLPDNDKLNFLVGVHVGFGDVLTGGPNETIGLVRDNLLELERKDKQTIDNFIEF